MAKFYGVIGFADTVEETPGEWIDDVIERPYSGDLIKNYASHSSSGNVNDNINISNQISILSDPYANEHFFNMKYVKFNIPNLGGVWKITNVDATNYPRLTLTIGGVYNGEQA